jgi:Uma2 family endonuclease
MSNLPLNIPPNLKVTQEQFAILAAGNRDVQLELTPTGELIIMPPTGGNTGKRNIDIDNGLRLGWLIDTKNQKVEIYRANQPVEVLHNPRSLSGEDFLPGFVLDLEVIFS